MYILLANSRKRLITEVICHQLTYRQLWLCHHSVISDIKSERVFFFLNRTTFASKVSLLIIFFYCYQYYYIIIIILYLLGRSVQAVQVCSRRPAEFPPATTWRSSHNHCCLVHAGGVDRMQQHRFATTTAGQVRGGGYVMTVLKSSPARLLVRSCRRQVFSDSHLADGQPEITESDCAILSSVGRSRCYRHGGAVF